MSIPETIKVAEAAERYCCCSRVIREAVKSGEIDAYKPGREILVDVRSGDEWFKSKKIGGVRRGRPRRR